MGWMNEYALHFAFDELFDENGLYGREWGRSTQHERTDLVDLFGLECVLQDFKVGDEFVLVFRVHLDAGHGDIAWT